MIDDNSDHALTLQREVKYSWSDKAELAWWWRVSPIASGAMR